MIKFPHLPKTDILNFIKSSVSLDRNILFKRTIPILSGVVTLLAGISIFIYRTFIKNRDRIFLSPTEFKTFMEFLKKEDVFLEKKTSDGKVHIEDCFRGCVLKSVYACAAYTKYLIKTSEDHSLRHVPYKDLLFDCSTRHVYSGHLDIEKIVESVGKKVDNSINKAISKCLVEQISRNCNPDDDQSIYNEHYKEYELKATQSIYFVDKRLLVSYLESDMSKKMGEKVDVFEINFIFEQALIGRLKEIDPNIKTLYEKDICHRGFIAIPTGFANRQEAKKLIRYYEEETRKLHKTFL